MRRLILGTFGLGKCGHGLTSRPRDSASELFLSELLGPFGIVLLVLLAELPLGGYQFLVVLLIWLLQVLVLCRRLLLMVIVRRFTGLAVLVRDGQEFDLTTKPCIPREFSSLISATCLEEIASCGDHLCSLPDRKRRRRDQDDVWNVPAQIRTGVGKVLGFVQAHVSRFARFLICRLLRCMHEVR